MMMMMTIMMMMMIIMMIMMIKIIIAVTVNFKVRPSRFCKKLDLDDI